MSSTASSWRGRGGMPKRFVWTTSSPPDASKPSRPSNYFPVWRAKRGKATPKRTFVLSTKRPDEPALSPRPVGDEVSSTASQCVPDNLTDWTKYGGFYPFFACLASSSKWATLSTRIAIHGASGMLAIHSFQHRNALQTPFFEHPDFTTPPFQPVICAPTDYPSNTRRCPWAVTRQWNSL